MSNTIPVIYESEVFDDAEKLARDEYGDIPLEALEADRFEVRTDSAHWANHIAPTLRSLSGFGDSGYGTYQEDRQVAVIPVGCGDDRPAQAELVSAKTFSQDVFCVFREEAYDCYERQRQERVES